MFSSQLRLARLYRRILPVILLIIVGLSPLPPAISTAQSTVLAASLPPGLTYTAGGQMYVVNLESGATIAQDAAPPKGSVIGPGNTLIWIEEEPIQWIDDWEPEPQKFQMVKSNMDGSNRQILVSSDIFYAKYPDFNEAPYTLSLSRDQQRIFFDPCKASIVYLYCTGFAFDLNSKSIANLRFGGFGRIDIAPDGSQAFGGIKGYCEGGGTYFHSYLLRKDDYITVGTGMSGAVDWPSNGQIVFSMMGNWTCDNIAETNRIRLADANGNKIRDLVLDVVVDDLVLSPDEQQIAYLTVQYNKSTYDPISKQLWIVNLDGTGNRKIADLSRDAGELRWFPACNIPPSTELMNEVNQLAISSDTRLNQVLALGQQVAQEGDYFAAQKKADEIKLIADGLTDSVSVLGATFTAVEAVQNATKIQMPGIVGHGWGHILELKKGSEAARNAFVDSLSLPVTTANTKLAGKLFLNGAYKYYAADMADQAAEDLLTDQAIEKGFLIGLQGDLALQSHMYPGLERLTKDLKQDITKTATNAPVVFPCMDTAQQALYTLDLKKRAQANVIIYSTLDQHTLPLHNAYEARINTQDSWIQDFLTKFFLRTTVTMAFDGPGAIAFEGGTFLWNIRKNTQSLTEDRKMMDIGVNALSGALDTQKRIYLNTVHGIDNITLGVPPQIPDLQEQSISNKSVGEYKIFGSLWWWERQSYSELHLSNPTTFNTKYQVTASYGNTGIQGTSYQPLVEERTVSIAPLRSNSIQVPYKDDKGGGGVSPDKDSTITFAILGNTDTGTYWVLNTATNWQPVRITADGQFASQLPAVLPHNAPTLPYPIRSRIASNADTMTYEPHLWVDNPFTYPIHVNVTQPLPSGVQIVDDHGGTVAGQSISWSQDIAPQTTIELTHTISYAGAANTIVTYPVAQLVMTDASANSATFTSDPALFQSLTPLIAEGTPVAHLLMNQRATIPFAIINRSSSNMPGIVHLTLTDLNGAQVYTRVQEVTVPANDQYDLTLPLQAPGSTGTYILTATVDSNGGSDEIFALYLEVTQPRVYMPSVSR